MFWKEIINHEMEFGWKKSEDADWLVYMRVHFEVACTFSSYRKKKKKKKEKKKKKRRKDIWLMKYIIIGLWSSEILQPLRILKKKNNPMMNLLKFLSSKSI